jgi:hypothetical protein
MARNQNLEAELDEVRSADVGGMDEGGGTRKAKLRGGARSSAGRQPDSEEELEEIQHLSPDDCLVEFNKSRMVPSTIGSSIAVVLLIGITSIGFMLDSVFPERVEARKKAAEEIKKKRLKEQAEAAAEAAKEAKGEKAKDDKKADENKAGKEGEKGDEGKGGKDGEKGDEKKAYDPMQSKHAKELNEKQTPPELPSPEGLPLDPLK